MTEIEPPIKKFKHLQDMSIDICEEYKQKIDNSKNLKAVLSDEFNKPLMLVRVYVGHIKDVKDISRTILELNEKFPLKELQHLKRVRRQDVILCPVNYLNGDLSIKDFIESSVPEIKDVFEFFKQVEVPFNPPKIERHYQEAKRIWSCNFHPNKYLEKITGDEFFSTCELSIHKMYMKIAIAVAKWYTIYYNIDSSLLNVNTTVVVDPKSENIVAIAFDNRQDHPMQHSAMLAIDNVAKTQNGGAWISNQDKEYVGIPEEVLPYLKENFPSLKFYENLESKNGKDKDGPYLCTGFYVYMLREPCVMCSMALVHARALRVFFCIDNTQCGALKSKAKLQTISSLNHHFEVFTGFV